MRRAHLNIFHSQIQTEIESRLHKLLPPEKFSIDPLDTLGTGSWFQSGSVSGSIVERSCVSLQSVWGLSAATLQSRCGRSLRDLS
jgi:hypothetical protein